MKWPCVARGTYVAAVEAIERERITERSDWIVWRTFMETQLAQSRASADHEVVRAEARYADLMASYRMLRLQGYADPSAIVPMAAVEVDQIEEAVTRASRGMPSAMRAGMLARARKEAETMPVEVVVARITQGHRPMDELV